jgi:hypothetical protein
MALQCMVAIDLFVLIALCLTFGRASNASQWSDASKLATELANDLICNDGWDPFAHVSPHQDLPLDATEFEAG